MKKKPFVKILSLALAAITLFVLCACGTAASSPAAGPVSDAAPTEASAASNGVLDEIKASGELHITLSPDFAPMEFIDSSKDGQEQYVGLDVFLAKYIADYIGVKLVIEPMSFDACQTAVYTASVPMSVSGYVWTEERAESYEISEDGTVYTIKIRPGQIWVDSQGRKIADVTADDWVAAAQHQADLQDCYDLNNFIAGMTEYLTGETTDFSTVGVKAVDDLTLQYTLKEPATYFISLLQKHAFLPLCRSYFLSQGGAFG